MSPSGRGARKGDHIVFGLRLIPTPLGGYPICRIRRESGDGGIVDRVGRFRVDSPPSKDGNSGREIRLVGPGWARNEYRRPIGAPGRWAPDLWGATHAGISNRITPIYCRWALLGQILKANIHSGRHTVDSPRRPESIISRCKRRIRRFGAPYAAQFFLALYATIHIYKSFPR